MYIPPVPAPSSTPPPQLPPLVGAVPTGDVAGLQLDTIQQKELGYFGRLLPADQQRIGTALPASGARVMELGKQLISLQALAAGATCRIGDETLDAFIARRPEAVQRGEDLLLALPVPSSLLAGQPSWADLSYQALLSNVGIARDGLGEAPLSHAATLLTFATRRT